MKFLSTFSGVGGFEKGITDSIPGAECIGVSEIDKYASQVLKYHYPEVKNYGDIRQIKPEDLPDFEILCGGFPCQSFSIAGQRLGFDDTRGTLFMKLRVLLKLKDLQFYSLRTSRGYSITKKGVHSRQLLQPLMSWGMMQNGNCSTANILVYPRIGNVCSLSDILEAKVGPQYFLSATQTKKILEQSGKKYPTQSTQTMPKDQVEAKTEAEDK